MEREEDIQVATVGPDVDTDDIDLGDLDDCGPPVRCSFITGAAGTGKTYMARERIVADPKEGLLCATTGIAAVNLNSTTINAQLKYFDTDSMSNAFISGRLTSRLAALAKQFRNLYVDEVSMMAAEQLDLLYQATRAANRQKGVVRVNPEGLGIVLTGDFAQLPPIKAKWAFEAECWSEFEAGVVRLEKNWRQGEGDFLAAINLLRNGEGVAGADALGQTATTFSSALDLDFDGTTIMSKNDEVDRFNWVRLRRLPTRAFTVKSSRWTWQHQHSPSEWKLIPHELELKPDAYVMILANARDFSYANGDCGWVVDRTPSAILVKLARNNRIVEVGSIDRHVHTSEKVGRRADDDNDDDNNGSSDKPVPETPTWGAPWFDTKAEKYVVGTVRYLPLRLAWASTVHKSQGLTLDRVQLDIRNAFFGSPAMSYVAVSRCRSAEGLRIVGDERLLAARCKIDPKVKRWV